MANRFEIGPTTEKTNAARAYEQRTGVDTSIAENVKQWRGETPDYSRSAFIPQVTGKVGVTVAPTTTRTSSGHTNPNGGAIGVRRYTRDELLGYDLTARDRELEAPKATATAARNAVAQARRDKAAGRATEDDVKAARRNLAAAQAAVSAVNDKYELAKRVQYEKKGDDELKALPSAALKQIEALYNVTTSTDAKSRLAAGVAATMGGPNRLSSMAAANRKAQDDAYAALATLGYSRQKVDQLLDYYTRRQDLEKYLAAYQDAEEKVNAGTGSAIGANLLSVGTNLASGAGQVDLTLQRIGQALSQDEWRKEAPLNYYSYGMRPYAWTQGVRQTTSGNILYDENGDERGGASKVLNSMYQAGMSMADSAAVAGMSMLGLPPGVGLTLLGGSAATSAMVDAVERGATDTQAVLTGLAAGVAEAMWESISLDSVLEIKALAKSAGKDTARRVAAQVLLNQAKTEGLEEIATDLTNAIMDQIINGDLSDFNTSYRQYLADGDTPEQAKTKAWADFAGQVALSGVMGTVTGGIMGGGSLGLQGAFANHKAKTTYSGNTAALLARAEKLGIDNKDTKTLAEKKDSATGGQIRAVVEDIVRQEIADTQEAKVARIERELKEAGAKGNVKQMAEALAARLTVEQTYADRPVEQAAAESVLQESLSRSLQRRLIRSEAAKMVYLQELTYFADETATTAAEETVAAAQTVAADTNFVGKTGTALADSVLAAARAEGVTNRMLTELVKNGGDVEAMTALGIDPAKLTTNTERRAALKQAIQARVESEKNNSTNPVAQNVQTEYNESEPTVRVDGTNGTWNMTRSEFKKWQQDYYTARNISVSEEQLDKAFDQLLAVQGQEAGAQNTTDARGPEQTATAAPAETTETPEQTAYERGLEGRIKNHTQVRDNPRRDVDELIQRLHEEHPDAFTNAKVGGKDVQVITNNGLKYLPQDMQDDLKALKAKYAALPVPEGRTPARVYFLRDMFPLNTKKGLTSANGVHINGQVVGVSLTGTNDPRTIGEHEYGHEVFYLNPELKRSADGTGLFDWFDELAASGDAPSDGDIADAYAAYAKVVGPLTEQNRDKYLEEVFCDLNAGVNRNDLFRGGTFETLAHGTRDVFESWVSETKKGDANGRRNDRVSDGLSGADGARAGEQGGRVPGRAGGEQTQVRRQAAPRGGSETGRRKRTAGTESRPHEGDYRSVGGQKEQKEVTHKLTGKPISKQYADALAALNAGQAITSEQYNAIPEVQEAKKRVAQSGEPTINIKTLARQRKRLDWARQLLDLFRSAEVDENGKTVYTGPVAQERRLDIVIGLPGSGKSSAVVDPLSFEHKSRLIDSDEAKKLIDEFDDGWGAGRVHQESKLVLNSALDNAMADGDNIVLPIVGGDYKSLEKYLDLAAESGYDVHVHLNDLDPNKAAGRVLSRFATDGRFVDLDITSFQYGNGPSETFDEYIRRYGDERARVLPDDAGNRETGRRGNRQAGRPVDKGGAEALAGRDGGQGLAPARAPRRVGGRQGLNSYTKVSNDVPFGQSPKQMAGSEQIDFDWKRKANSREAPVEGASFDSVENGALIVPADEFQAMLHENKTLEEQFEDIEKLWAEYQAGDEFAESRLRNYYIAQPETAKFFRALGMKELPQGTAIGHLLIDHLNDGALTLPQIEELLAHTGRYVVAAYKAPPNAGNLKQDAAMSPAFAEYTRRAVSRAVRVLFQIPGEADSTDVAVLTVQPEKPLMEKRGFQKPMHSRINFIASGFRMDSGKAEDMIRKAMRSNTMFYYNMDRMQQNGLSGLAEDLDARYGNNRKPLDRAYNPRYSEWIGKAADLLSIKGASKAAADAQQGNVQAMLSDDNFEDDIDELLLEDDFFDEIPLGDPLYVDLIGFDDVPESEEDTLPPTRRPRSARVSKPTESSASYLAPEMPRYLSDVAAATERRIEQGTLMYEDLSDFVDMSEIPAKDRDRATASTGELLSKGQALFFWNSLLRDDDGRLMTMYHGTGRHFGFSAFSRDKIFLASTPYASLTYAAKDAKAVITADEMNSAREAVRREMGDPDPRNDTYASGETLDALAFDRAGYDKARPYTQAPSRESGLIEGAKARLRSATGQDRGGIYSVYGNCVNPLIIDAKGRTWNHLWYAEVDILRNPAGLVWHGSSTDGIYSAAIANGYDSVIFHNIYDYLEGRGPFLAKPFTVAVLKTSNQVKSSNNWVPTNDPDMQFMMPEDANPRDYNDHGVPLTEAQQEFFKDSVARNDRGQLIEFFVGRRKFKFDTFDPQFMDDKRSLFFTDSPAVASTYSGWPNRVKLLRTLIHAVTKDTDYKKVADYPASPYPSYDVSDEDFHERLLASAANDTDPHKERYAAAVNYLRGKGFTVSDATLTKADALDRITPRLEGAKDEVVRLTKQVVRQNPDFMDLLDDWGLGDALTDFDDAETYEDLTRALAAATNAYRDAVSDLLAYSDADAAVFADALMKLENLTDYLHVGLFSGDKLDVGRTFLSQLLPDEVGDFMGTDIYAPALRFVRVKSPDAAVGTRIISEDEVIYQATALERMLEDEDDDAPGIYSIYANLESPLVIDAQGAKWNEIPITALAENLRPLAAYVVKKRHLEYLLYQAAKLKTTALVPGPLQRASDASANGLRAQLQGLMRQWAETGTMEYSDTDKMRTRDVSEIAELSGYDGVLIHDCVDIGALQSSRVRDEASTIGIAFRANQLKSTANDAPTNDDRLAYMLPEDMNQLPDAGEFLQRYFSVETLPPVNPAASTSIAEVPGDQQIRIILKPRNDSLGSAKQGFDPYSEAELKYGVQESRPNAYRYVDAPVSMDGKTRVTQSTVTVGGSKATPETRLKDITDAVVNGDLSHEIHTDQLANNRARNALNKRGWDQAYSDWVAKVKSGVHDKDTVAMGALLLNTAGNGKNVSGELYVDILTDYAAVLTRAGQVLQAGKLIQKLTPMGKLYGIQRSIDDLNEEILKRAEKAGVDADTIEIDKTLLVKYRDAQTEEERDAALQEIYQNIADQVPATGMDKFTAWRYLAMLGNFRTQIRNVVGNAGFQPVRMLKESAAGLMEAIATNVFGSNMERTTSAFYDRDTFREAFSLFKHDSDLIMSGGKYQDSKIMNREIENRRRIFKNRALEAYRKATNYAMDKGDVLFCSFTYADSLARFMKANGTTWSDASPELREKARLKAIRDAAEATYRDTNAFAEAISGLMRQNPGNNPVRKAINLIGEGVLPFRKTPANILLRAVEYSPLNLVDNAIKIAQYNLAKAETVENPGKVAQVYNKAVTASKEAEVTGADIISSLAKTLTGSALVLLGTALASMGALKGKAPEDDKEKEFWDLTGHQEYAIEIGGKSYTLDWLAPEAIPLYLGANLHQAAIEGGLTLKETIEAVGSITDPLLQMSMLQGVNDALENASTYGDESALPRFVQNSMWSYVTQLVPTIVGQTNRASTNTRMQTYVDKNKDIPDFWQQLAGKLTSRIPGLNNLTNAQIEYIDAWGRTEKNADTATINALYQFFSPGYASTIEESPMEKELLRLYDATGEKSVLVTRAPKYFNVDGERYDLSGSEYLTYSQTRGQTAYRVMTDLTKGAEYRKLTDAQKAKAAENVYKYANELAKERTVRGYQISDKWIAEARQDANDYGIPVSKYITLYSSGINETTGIKDSNGDTITNTAGMRKARMIYNSLPGLTDAQYQKLMEDFDVGQTVRGWSPALIERKLKALGD